MIYGWLNRLQINKCGMYTKYSHRLENVSRSRFPWPRCAPCGPRKRWPSGCRRSTIPQPLPRCYVLSRFSGASSRQLTPRWNGNFLLNTEQWVACQIFESWDTYPDILTIQHVRDIITLVITQSNNGVLLTHQFTCHVLKNILRLVKSS